VLNLVSYIEDRTVLKVCESNAGEDIWTSEKKEYEVDKRIRIIISVTSHQTLLRCLVQEGMIGWGGGDTHEIEDKYMQGLGSET
jgi:hypothetical protein